jgi:hypothetical protein
VSFLEVEGATFGVFTPVTWRYADAIRGEVNRPVVGAPAITLTLERDVEYAQANVPIQRPVTIEVRSHHAAQRVVEVRLSLPPGLVADSAVRTLALRESGPAAPDDGSPHRDLQCPQSPGPGRHEIVASATGGGGTYTTGYAGVAYGHIDTQRLYRPALLGISAVDIQLPRAAAIGYIPGVGDNVAPVLQQLGLDVTVLDPAALARTDLSRFTSVVVGSRAYEASPALAAGNARLLDYARRGGTLVVQYGQYEMLAPGLMPAPITLSRPADRVTVEGAPVRIVDPAASVLAAPNRITARDFEGWIQDRALYMPRTVDSLYRAPLEMGDPGEADRGRLWWPHGRGTYHSNSRSASCQWRPRGGPTVREPARGAGGTRGAVGRLGTNLQSPISNLQSPISVGTSRPRVVIVGGGFGGVAAAQRLRNANVDVLVIDRHNHFVFQPLLYQVASGSLSPSDIAVPIRWYLRKQANTTVLLGEVTGLDLDRREITMDRPPCGRYGFLIVAAGRHAYFARRVGAERPRPQVARGRTAIRTPGCLRAGGAERGPAGARGVADDRDRRRRANRRGTRRHHGVYRP